MNVYLFYTRNTPADRDIAYWQKRLTELRITPQLIDADSREGVALAELYDVVQRPGVVVADQDGRLMQKWQDRLPSPDEVSSYFTAA